MPTATRLVRVREYEADQIIIDVTLNQESYLPGDNVTGSISVRNADNSSFIVPPTFSFSLIYDTLTIFLQD